MSHQQEIAYDRPQLFWEQREVDEISKRGNRDKSAMD